MTKKRMTGGTPPSGSANAAEQRIQQMQAQINTLSRERDEMRRALQQQQQTLAEVTRNAASANQRARELLVNWGAARGREKETRERAQRVIARRKEAEAELNVVRATKDDLEAKMAEAERQIASLKDAAQRATAEKDAVSATMAQQAGAHAALVEQNRALNEQLNPQGTDAYVRAGYSVGTDGLRFSVGVNLEKHLRGDREWRVYPAVNAEIFPAFSKNGWFVGTGLRHNKSSAQYDQFGVFTNNRVVRARFGYDPVIAAIGHNDQSTLFGIGQLARSKDLYWGFERAMTDGKEEVPFTLRMFVPRHEPNSVPVSRPAAVRVPDVYVSSVASHAVEPVAVPTSTMQPAANGSHTDFQVLFVLGSIFTAMAAFWKSRRAK